MENAWRPLHCEDIPQRAGGVQDAAPCGTERQGWARGQRWQRWSASGSARLLCPPSRSSSASRERGGGRTAGAPGFTHSLGPLPGHTASLRPTSPAPLCPLLRWTMHSLPSGSAWTLVASQGVRDRRSCTCTGKESRLPLTLHFVARPGLSPRPKLALGIFHQCRGAQLPPGPFPAVLSRVSAWATQINRVLGGREASHSLPLPELAVLAAQAHRDLSF